MIESMTRRTFIKGTAAAAVLAGPLRGLAAVEKPQTINLAFIGCAHIHTSQFISILQTRADVKVKYAWDHSAARAQKYAKDLNAKVVTNLDEIWGDPAIAGVVITSETNCHLELVLAAVKAQKHLFVEKPLGTNVADAAAMADAIEKAGLLFNTGYDNRSMPHHWFIKEQIAKGTFGKISRAYASRCHNAALEGWFDGDFRWMADPKIAGFGALGDLGTHPLDLLMWLLGDVEAVTADVKSVTGRYGDCDETGEALVRFKNGAIGTVAASYVALKDPVTLMISGTEAHAMMYDNHLFFVCPKIGGADGRKMWTKLPRPLSHPLLLWADAVAGTRDIPLVKPREAAERVRVMEAIYRAAREKKWITV